MKNKKRSEDIEDRELFVGEAHFGFGFIVLDAGGEGKEFGAGCGFDEFLLIFSDCISN